MIPATMPPAFSAETGLKSYDSIRFSGPPNAVGLSSPDGRISIVRHMGVAGDSDAWASGQFSNVDALIVNLGASKRLRGRLGNLRLDKPLHRGHVSYIPHDCPVDIEFPSEHDALLLFVADADLHRVDEGESPPPARPFASERHSRLVQLIDLVGTELQTPGFASELMLDGLVRAIGATLARHGASAPDAEGGRIRLSPVHLARIRDFVEARLDEEIHLADLARIAGLSVFHFSRVFKAETGETPYHYVASRRLERARSLLGTDDMPLAQLALARGFASQSHFTAAFTRAMGVPPGRYRRMRRL